MRIRTNGDYSYRASIIDECADRYQRNKTDAIMRSIQMDQELRKVLAAALDHPDMTEELASAMNDANRRVDVEYRVDVTASLSGDLD